MSTTTPNKILLTAREAARLLSLCEKSLYLLTKRGEVPVVKIGRSVRYDPGDLKAFVDRMKRTE